MNKQDYERYYSLREGLLLVVSGPSGVGKSLICEEYVKRNADVMLSRSETTRPRRGGEVDGVEYTFVTNDVFEKRAEEGYYLEWARKFDKCYGTPKGPIIKALKENRSVILEIETQGAMQVKRQFPEAVFVFVLPSSLQVLRERIESRQTESSQEIDKRLADFQKELDCLPEYDYVIVNQTGKLEEAIDVFSAVVDSERHSVKRILDQNLGGTEIED